MIFLKKIIFFIFLDRSDEVMLKIIFLKYFDLFSNKLFF